MAKQCAVVAVDAVLASELARRGADSHPHDHRYSHPGNGIRGSEPGGGIRGEPIKGGPQSFPEKMGGFLL